MFLYDLQDTSGSSMLNWYLLVYLIVMPYDCNGVGLYNHMIVDLIILIHCCGRRMKIGYRLQLFFIDDG